MDELSLDQARATGSNLGNMNGSKNRLCAAIRSISLRSVDYAHRPLPDPLSGGSSER